MRTKKTIALVAAIAGLAYSNVAYGLTTEEPRANVTLQFVDSKNFTDIELGYLSHERDAKKVMKSISEAFQKAADRYLPSGYTLDIQVTNIDLAGDRSPLTSTFGDIRVYRDLYPPRIHFSYAVYDAQEKLVSSGQVKKTDLSYLQTLRGVGNRSDEKAPYVAELVRGWASKSLQELQTSRD